MPKLTVYTTWPCVQCNLTKNMLEREGIEYDTVKLQDVPDLVEKFKAEGLLQAPIVVVGNDGRRWSGFRPDLIEELAAGATVEQ
jgi:glutaredoxin-like protein NrdH